MTFLFLGRLCSPLTQLRSYSGSCFSSGKQPRRSWILRCRNLLIPSLFRTLNSVMAVFSSRQSRIRFAPISVRPQPSMSISVGYLNCMDRTIRTLRTFYPSILFQHLGYPPDAHVANLRVVSQQNRAQTANRVHIDATVAEGLLPSLRETGDLLHLIT